MSVRRILAKTIDTDLEYEAIGIDLAKNCVSAALLTTDGEVVCIDRLDYSELEKSAQALSSTTFARFIPAYAGNSTLTYDNDHLPPVHPRLRGELVSCRRCHHRGCGSSPLTRGTHAQDLTACFNQRFIPAYAGNSGESKMGWWADSVHPRLRGELNLQLRGLFDTLGSSPLTRGTLCKKR